MTGTVHGWRCVGCMMLVSVVDGLPHQVCSAKVQRLGEKVGHPWRLHVHPQNVTEAAYVRSSGEVKWNLSEVDVPTLECLVREDSIEMQDVRELGVGWS